MNYKHESEWRHKESHHVYILLQSKLGWGLFRKEDKVPYIYHKAWFPTAVQAFGEYPQYFEPVPEWFNQLRRGMKFENGEDIFTLVWLEPIKKWVLYDPKRDVFWAGLSSSPKGAFGDSINLFTPVK